MKYLVLRKFKSYDVFYKKGDVVDATKIRNPRIKESAGNIVAIIEDTRKKQRMVREQVAVPSSNASGDVSTTAEASPLVDKESNKVKLTFK